MTRHRTEPPNLLEVIKRLEKRVSDLESGNRIGNTAIDRGNLNVQSGSSIRVYHPEQANWPVVRIGDIESLSLWGVRVSQARAGVDDDEQSIMEIGAVLDDEFDVFDKPVFTVYGATEFPVIDTASEWGLQSPAIAYNYGLSSEHFGPSQSTTSAIFAPVYTVWGYTYHETILVDYVIQNDVGTTSEVRLREAVNSGVATVKAHTSGEFAYAGISYNHVNSASLGEPFPGMFFKADLEIRRTSGAGLAKIAMIGAVGI